MTKANRLMQSISELYNNHHQDLSADLKEVLLETAQVIEAKGNVAMAAMRLNRFLKREITCFQMGLKAPKALLDLYQLTVKSPIDLWLGRND